MEGLRKVPILRKIFKAPQEPTVLNPEPEPEKSKDEEALLAPAGTYDRLFSLIGESESGVASVGKFNFKRYLSLSSPSPNSILLFHKVKDGKSMHPHTSWHIHITDSDKVIHFDLEHSEKGRVVSFDTRHSGINTKPSLQENLNEALAGIDKTIKTGKLFDVRGKEVLK